MFYLIIITLHRWHGVVYIAEHQHVVSDGVFLTQLRHLDESEPGIPTGFPSKHLTQAAVAMSGYLTRLNELYGKFTLPTVDDIGCKKEKERIRRASHRIRMKDKQKEV